MRHSLNHCHLLPELAGEDVFRDEGVDTAYDIHCLRHTKAHGNAAQSIGIELADLRLGREELNRVACSNSQRRLQIFVEAHSDLVRTRLCNRPSQVLLLVQQHLDLQLLHPSSDAVGQISPSP